jgi:hypothetical protein
LGERRGRERDIESICECVQSQEGRKRDRERKIKGCAAKFRKSLCAGEKKSL